MFTIKGVTNQVTNLKTAAKMKQTLGKTLCKPVIPTTD